jgi:ABC-type phosphate transport system permease subunit
MAELTLKNLEKKASTISLRRKPRWGETIIQGLLFFSGFFSIFITLGIVYELGKEALLFFPDAGGGSTGHINHHRMETACQ